MENLGFLRSFRARGWRVWPVVSAPLVLVLLTATIPAAQASLIGQYQASDTVLTNSADANGFVMSPDGGLTLIFTGPNTGSGLPGTTDLILVARASGLVSFNHLYSSLDTPGYDFASYFLGSDFYRLADTDGESGTVSFPVLAGAVFGFRMGTDDNQGEPGMLTVTDFSAPVASEVPEPATLSMMLCAAGAALVFRGRSGVRRVLPGLTRGWKNLLVVAALAASGSTQLSAQSQQTYTGSAVTGQLYLARVVNLRQMAAQRLYGFASFAPEVKPKAPPKRLGAPPLASYGKLASALATQTYNSLQVIGASGGFGFEGLSHYDMREADSGNQWSIEPPNLNIAVGNGYVLEGVNTAVRVYDLTGAPTLPIVLSSNQVFGLASAINRTTGVNGPYLTDTRVFYDQGINRFFILQRGQDNDVYGDPLNQSHIYLAVSRTADPAGDYGIYIMDTTDAANPGCPCVADYPQIGSDEYGFHIAWNEFSTFGERFVDAAVLSISKTSLAAGATTPVSYRFLIPYGSGFEFALQPATTPPGASNFLASGGLAYFVSTNNGFGTANQVALWAMTNTSSLATPAPAPTLIRSLVSTLSYTVPPVARQRSGPLPYGSTLDPAGSLALLDGGDTRVQSLSYAGGRLFVTMQSRVLDQQGVAVAGGAYVVLSPSYRSNRLTAQVLNQGLLYVNNQHLLRPSLAVNSSGRGAIAVTLVGPDWYPSAAFIPFEPLATPATINIAALGTLPEDGFTGYPGGYGPGVARWGDYNSAVATADGSIWMGVQYIGSRPRTEFANWQTYVIRK